MNKLLTVQVADVTRHHWLQDKGESLTFDIQLTMDCPNNK